MRLRRQDQTATSPTSQPSTTTTSDARPALDAWQIALIVIGCIILLSALATFFILQRRRRDASLPRFDISRDRNVDTEFQIDNAYSPSTKHTPTHTRRGSTTVHREQERRPSVVEDAKSQIRRILNKRPRSSSYPTGTTPYNKKGLDFGLGALRFGGAGAGGNGGEKEDGVSTSTHTHGKKKRRKSQIGIDVRLRSADDHTQEEYLYGSPSSGAHAGGGGKAPFMRNENATGSGSAFAVGGTPRKEDDLLLSTSPPTGGGGPGGRLRTDSEERYWNYGDHSIAHTVRGSFEDAEEEERQRSLMQQLQQQQLGAAVERLAMESSTARSHSGHER